MSDAEASGNEVGKAERDQVASKSDGVQMLLMDHRSQLQKGQVRLMPQRRKG